MGGDSEYEPKDSRKVTGGGAEQAPGTPGPDWHGQPRGHGGEYEPRDSRNVTGTASTPDGRWTNTDGKTPLAAGGGAGAPGRSPDGPRSGHGGGQAARRRGSGGQGNGGMRRA